MTPNFKQTKLEAFFPLSQPLASDDLLPSLPSPSAQLAYLESVTPPSSLCGNKQNLPMSDKETSLDQEPDNLLMKYSLLTAQTVDQIFTQLTMAVELLKGLYRIIPTMQSINSNPHAGSNLCLPEKAVANPSCMNSPTLTYAPKTAQLIYDPNCAAISVSLGRGKYSDWSRIKHAKIHLATLLKVASSTIDLLKIEKLPSSHSMDRFLLFFTSNRIPGLLFSRAGILRRTGIFPQRHFRNTTIVSLLPLKPNLRDSKTMAPAPESPPNTGQSSNISPAPRDCLLDLPPPTDLPSPLIDADVNSDCQKKLQMNPVDRPTGTTSNRYPLILESAPDPRVPNCPPRILPDCENPTLSLCPDNSSFPTSLFPTCIVDRHSSDGSFLLVDASTQLVPPLNFNFTNPDTKGDNPVCTMEPPSLTPSCSAPAIVAKPLPHQLDGTSMRASSLANNKASYGASSYSTNTDTLSCSFNSNLPC